MRCIYIIINLINGKKYIGSTSNFSRRVNEHRSMLRNNKHPSNYLQNSWNKYGEENFKFIILRKVSFEENLINIEQLYLDKYKVYLKKYGYNTNIIANSGGNNEKEIYQIDLKGNILNKFKNSVIASKELNIKPSGITYCANGKLRTYKKYIWIFVKDYSLDILINRVILGNLKGHSEETKEKMRISRSKIKNNGKSIIKLDLLGNFIEEYKSLNQASKLNNISIELISGCCKGKYRKGKGFKWKFKE